MPLAEIGIANTQMSQRVLRQLLLSGLLQKKVPTELALSWSEHR